MSSGSDSESDDDINDTGRGSRTFGIRCRPTNFVRFYNKRLKKKFTEAHHAEMRKTPFYHFLKMPEMSTMNELVREIVRCFKPDDMCFDILGNKVTFTPRDVSLILGLKNVNNVFSIYDESHHRLHTGDKGSPIHQEYFNGQKTVGYKALEALLLDLVEQPDKTEDFIKLLVLYLFTTVLFPMSSGSVPLSFIPLVENLDQLHNIAWSFIVHQYLMESIVTTSKKMQEGLELSLSGCTIVLVIWFLEHTKSYQLRRMNGGIPRYYNWKLEKLRIKAQRAKEIMGRAISHGAGIRNEDLDLEGSESEVLSKGCSEDLLVPYEEVLLPRTKRKRDAKNNSKPTIEEERQLKEQQEREQRERLEREKQEREEREREQLEREQQEREQLEREQREKEQLEREQLERDEQDDNHGDGLGGSGFVGDENSDPNVSKLSKVTKVYKSSKALGPGERPEGSAHPEPKENNQLGLELGIFDIEGPNFSLGLGLTQPSPPSSPVVTVPAFNQNHENEEKYLGTPPGFFEEVFEITDFVASWFYCPDDLLNSESHSPALDNVLNNQSHYSYSKLLPVNPKSVIEVFGNILPFVDWKAKYMVKVSKSGRPLTKSSLMGSPYADPFQSGISDGKKKFRNVQFWSKFTFANGIKAGDKIKRNMNEFLERIQGQNADDVLYHFNKLQITVQCIISILTGGSIDAETLTALLRLVEREVEDKNDCVIADPMAMMQICSGNLKDCYDDCPSLFSKIEECKQLLCVIGHNKQWTLLCVNFEEEEIRVFSSAKPRPRGLGTTIDNKALWLRHFLHWRFQGDKKMMNLKVVWEKDLPVQKKKEDSGIFVIRFVVSIFLSQPIHDYPGDTTNERILLATNLLLDPTNSKPATIFTYIEGLRDLKRNLIK